MFKELTRNLQLANEALARYYESGDPFDDAIYRLAAAKLNRALQAAETLPECGPTVGTLTKPSE